MSLILTSKNDVFALAIKKKIGASLQFFSKNFHYKGEGLCKTRYKNTIFFVRNPSYFYVFKLLGFLMASCVSEKMSRGFRFFGVAGGGKPLCTMCKNQIEFHITIVALVAIRITKSSIFIRT